MATRLLVCEKGFLDSEELLPVDGSGLEKVGEFDGAGMSEQQIDEQARQMGATYFAQPRIDSTVVAYTLKPE